MNNENMNMDENSLFEPSGSNDHVAAQHQIKWGFINIEPAVYDEPDYESIISMIMSFSNERGMTLAEPVVREFNLRMWDLPHMLVQCLDKNVQFVVIILPDSERYYHHKVNQLSDEMGVLTQCVKVQSVQPAQNENFETIRGIVKKVSEKLFELSQAARSSCLPASFQGLNIQDD